MSTIPGNGRRSTRAVRRGALAAAAGIALAAAGGPSAVQAEEAKKNEPVAKRPADLGRGNIKLDSQGVSFHSDGLAKLWEQDRPAALAFLQRRFPGVTAEQVQVGAEGNIRLAVGRGKDRAAYERDLQKAMVKDNGCGNTINVWCSEAAVAMKNVKARQ